MSGTTFLDQYSLLHFAVGILFYFWNISLVVSTVTHGAVQLLSNSKAGTNFVNNYMPQWPGGKPRADNYLNMAGDSASFTMGWLLASAIDVFGSEQGWYEKHAPSNKHASDTVQNETEKKEDVKQTV